MTILISVVLTFTLFNLASSRNKEVKYTPTWDSLDSRPLPSWYDEAKLGIFIHWGVFSVQSYSSEWAWYNWKEKKSPSFIKFLEKNYPKDITYQDFAKDFTAELFDPNQWAEIFHSSGAKYVVLVSKHHEGYTLWPSNYSFSWNAMDVGPRRDLVGDLKSAIDAYPDLKFGLYHSMYEWYNPLYLADKNANFTNLSKVNFVDTKIIPALTELVEKYKPYVMWSDGDWEASSSYWKSAEFLAWLYNESPVKDKIVVNDRWGQETLCKHGGFLTCADRFNPGTLQKRKWENAMSIDNHSWGYRRTANVSQYATINDIIGNLTSTVSCGGNLLLNVGPTKDGIIAPIYEERLLQLGSWMKVNGEAIYSSVPWTVCQNDSLTPNVWYTTNKDKTILYATFSPWPRDGKLKLKCPQFNLESKAQLLGVDGHIQFMASEGLVILSLPDKAIVTSEWVWTLKMKSVTNLMEDIEVTRRKMFQEEILVTTEFH